MIETPDMDGGQGGAKSWDAVEESWVIEHAKEVQRMMPGGLMVLGIYFFCPSEQVGAAAASVSCVRAHAHALAAADAGGVRAPCLAPVTGVRGEHKEQHGLLHPAQNRALPSCCAAAGRDRRGRRERGAPVFARLLQDEAQLVQSLPGQGFLERRPPRRWLRGARACKHECAFPCAVGRARLAVCMQHVCSALPVCLPLADGRCAAQS